ncbi:hypothetical protein [Streptomyces sp. NBC_00057]|uniref:hypothetical protein n=1 Tax=Streptomyces sp. NBC_00057 TaxID=2975634 RepID=UPI00324C4AAD
MAAVVVGAREFDAFRGDGALSQPRLPCRVAGGSGSVRVGVFRECFVRGRPVSELGGDVGGGAGGTPVEPPGRQLGGDVVDVLPLVDDGPQCVCEAAQAFALGPSNQRPDPAGDPDVLGDLPWAAER